MEFRSFKSEVNSHRSIKMKGAKVLEKMTKGWVTSHLVVDRSSGGGLKFLNQRFPTARSNSVWLAYEPTEK